MTVADVKKMFPDSKKPFEDLCKKFCVVFDIEITGIKAKIFQENYIVKVNAQHLKTVL